MKPARSFTTQPFTVAICTACGGDVSPQLLEMVQYVVRRCPHGVLVLTQCLLGPLTCAVRPDCDSAMLVLQQCSADRTPNAPTRWIGPITDMADARLACAWVASGDWDCRELPDRLRADRSLQRTASLN